MDSLLVLILFLTLILVIVVLLVSMFKLSKDIKEERKQFAKERSDMINRIISKSTADYRELTKVTNAPDAERPAEKPRNLIDEQLERMGALESGATNMYRGM